jgi:hypothetical protein
MDDFAKLLGRKVGNAENLIINLTFDLDLRSALDL